MKETITNNIKDINLSIAESEYAVVSSVNDIEEKFTMVLENCDTETDVDIFVVQEGAIGDEMKKMKKDDESKAATILKAIPRFIMALVKVVSAKLKKSDTNKLSDAEKEHVHAVVNEILNDDPKNESTKSTALIKSAKKKGVNVTIDDTMIKLASAEPIKGKKIKGTSMTTVNFRGVNIGIGVACFKNGKIATNIFFNDFTILFDTWKKAISKMSDEQIKSFNQTDVDKVLNEMEKKLSGGRKLTFVSSSDDVKDWDNGSISEIEDKQIEAHKAGFDLTEELKAFSEKLEKINDKEISMNSVLLKAILEELMINVEILCAIEEQFAIIKNVFAE